MVALAASLFLAPFLTAASNTVHSPASSPSPPPVCRNEPPNLLERLSPPGDKYLVGAGKADITGPVAELALAGYGKFDQAGTGLRQRLYSRAFIVADVKDPNDRIAYLVLDDLAGDTAVRYGAIEALAEAGGEYALYNKNNIALTATHTHSGPGGFFNYLLPQAPTLGLDKQSYQAVVDGIVLSIKRAHDSLEEGYVDMATTQIHNASINRSPHAYLQNPASERVKYSSNVDNTMTVLRFQRARDLRSVGMLSFFAVHGTSITNTNRHVAGDNKGVASWLFEKSMAEQPYAAADGFVAGFSQTTEGDVSPNILGPWCGDGSGEMCDFEKGNCPDGSNQKCQGRGPEYLADEFGIRSCYEIGRRQYMGAKKTFDSMETTTTTTPLRGRIKSIHFFQNMSNYTFSLPNGTLLTSCPPAFGYAALAGCTDGAGMKGFSQATVLNPPTNLWSLFFTSVRKPTPETRACHAPKPIVFDAGFAQPYAWAPSVVDIQLMRLGQLVVAISPSEVTTMSGRRWREALLKEAQESIGKDAVTLVAGPANTYAHYVTTPEEYAVQRYEGGSTMFGPNQLAAYINLTVSNLHYLADGSMVLPLQRTMAGDNRKNSWSLFPRVYYDRTPWKRAYGEVLVQPADTYRQGSVISATFQGANPRNNLRLEDTYVAVEKLVDGEWLRVRDDADYFLVYTWRRTSLLLGYSEVDVTWETAPDDEKGVYRLKYYGDAKRMFGHVEAFEGTSASFELL